jgi:hypothetical protein
VAQLDRGGERRLAAGGLAWLSSGGRLLKPSLPATWNEQGMHDDE